MSWKFPIFIHVFLPMMAINELKFPMFIHVFLPMIAINELDVFYVYTCILTYVGH